MKTCAVDFRKVLLVAICLICCREAGAAIVFEKIADTSTAIPDGTGTFTGFGTDFNQPSISNSNVAFLGTGSGGQVGVYADFGAGVVVVADTGTTIPGVGGTFTNFEFPVISGANVSYTGFGASSFEGVFLDTGSGPTTIADTTTTVPGEGGPFTSFFGAQDLDGSHVVIPGLKQTVPTQSGIYGDFGSGLVTIADRNTAIPGGVGDFTILVDPSVSGTNVAFNGFGSSSQRGIYADFGSGLVAIADKNTAIPGGTGNFDFLSFAQLSGTNVIFRGNDAGSTQTGIYGDFGSGLVAVADQNTAIPEGAGTFEVIGLASISGDDVAFTAGFGGGTEVGLYALFNGSYVKILDSTELLDGKALVAGQTGINFGINAFSGNQVVFEASFADGSRGVYVATIEETPVVPEPSTLALLTLGAVGLSLRQLRFRRRRCERLHAREF